MSILDVIEKDGCFALFVFMVSRDCCVALPHDAMGLSAVCDCGITRSYSLTFFFTYESQNSYFTLAMSFVKLSLL